MPPLIWLHYKGLVVRVSGHLSGLVVSNLRVSDHLSETEALLQQCVCKAVKPGLFPSVCTTVLQIIKEQAQSREK